MPPLIPGSGRSGEGGRVRGFAALGTQEAPVGARAMTYFVYPSGCLPLGVSERFHDSPKVAQPAGARAGREHGLA